MEINKSKVAIGFIVAGVLAVIFGTLLAFVGPIIIDDQIVKVSSLLTRIISMLKPVFDVRSQVCLAFNYNRSVKMHQTDSRYCNVRLH